MDAMDSNFVAEEMELYDEIRSTLDEDELLIIMSNLQEHFLEKLAYQNEQRRIREEAMKSLQETTETDGDSVYTTNYEDLTSDIFSDDESYISTTTPIDPSFAYPDDSSNPFQLPPRQASDIAIHGHTKTTNTNNKSKRSQSNFTKSSATSLYNQSLTKSNLNKHNNKSSSSKRGLIDLNRVKSLQQSSSSSLTQTQTQRQRAQTTNSNGSLSFNPQASAGAYRLDLFCDIKFVKNVFIRWISCKNEVLCHVSVKTLGILFGHSFLTPDQFLDLAELVLGVHEENNAIFGNVEVTYRESRPGMFYGDVDDSTSVESSDYESTPEPDRSSSEDSADNLLEDIAENIQMSNHKSSNLTQIKEETAETLTDDVNENDKKFLAKMSKSRRASVTSASSASSGSTNRSSVRGKLRKIPFDVHWDNRLYSAMKILSYIVSNDDVYEGCVVALDEWFSLIVIDLFVRSRKAGMGVLEMFLYLIKSILTRFAKSSDVMGQCKLSQVLCSDANTELLDIVTSRTSTIVTRASALELCPLLMQTSEIGSKQFSMKCLVSILDDGRFNPFEPGDITMSRTFQRGDHGQLRSINEKNPLAKTYTVANYVPSLLFERNNDVFIDSEAVQRLTFLCIIKAINILSLQIMAIDENKKEEKAQVDDEAIVEKLEGEFDDATARKIRNFFSRDAEYTRLRVLELVEEEDDVLIQVLLELLLIENALRKSQSRLAVRFRYLFDPFMMFYDFIDYMDADYSFLMDYLISNETQFLQYLLRFCKRMSANWNPTNATKEQINRVMSILIRLRMHIQSLHSKGAFPFSPKALLKAMERVEFCYENEQNAAKKNKETNMFDLDYLNYVKRKKIKQEQKKEEEKLKRKKKKEKKPKKMNISDLFLQDVKQQALEEKRKSLIEANSKQILAKRARKKRKRESQTGTKKKGNDEFNMPSMTVLRTEDSKATHIIKTNRKKVSESSRKKRKLKNRMDLSSLKKIDFKKRIKQG